MSGRQTIDFTRYPRQCAHCYQELNRRHHICPANVGFFWPVEHPRAQFYHGKRAVMELALYLIRIAPHRRFRITTTTAFDIIGFRKLKRVDAQPL